MKDGTVSEGLEGYAEKSREELITLREAYKEKIRRKSQNHWLTILEKHFNRSLYSLIFKLGFLLAIIPMLLLLFGGILSFFYKDLLRDYLFSPFILIFALPVVGVGIIQFLDDGTVPEHRKLRDIEIVLARKEPDYRKKILIDTNVFHKFISGELTLEDIKIAKGKGYSFYITHVQSDQISNTEKDPEKRRQLVLFMTAISPRIVETESTIPGISRKGFSKPGVGQIIQEFTDKGDALIAEAAILNQFTLLTEDTDLMKKVRNDGGSAYSTQDFLRIIKIRE